MSACLATKATSSVRTEVTPLFYLYLFPQLLTVCVVYNEHLLIEQMCALMNARLAMTQLWPTAERLPSTIYQDKRLPHETISVT